MKKMRYILGIQTIEYPNQIALLGDDSKTSFVKIFKQREKTIENLSKSVEQLISKAKRRVSDIAIVAVCLGPGSYTGSRGGLGFAKGFCQFSKIPLVGVSAFEALRENVKNVKNVGNVRSVNCLIDGKNERVFYHMSHACPTKLRRSVVGSKVKGQGLKILDKHDIQIDHIKNVITNISEKTLFIGSGAIANKKTIKEKLGEKASFLKRDLNQITASNIAIAGYEKYKKDDSIFTTDYLYKIKPLYILPPRITKPKNKR